MNNRQCYPLVKIGTVGDFDLYLHEKQVAGSWVKSRSIEIPLIDTGLIRRTVSPKDTIVLHWRAFPWTYPDEFKERKIFLWNSGMIEFHYSKRVLSFLVWENGVVVNYLCYYSEDRYMPDVTIVYNLGKEEESAD